MAHPEVVAGIDRAAEAETSGRESLAEIERGSKRRISTSFLATYSYSPKARRPDSCQSSRRKRVPNRVPNSAF